MNEKTAQLESEEGLIKVTLTAAVEAGETITLGQFDGEWVVISATTSRGPDEPLLFSQRRFVAAAMANDLANSESQLCTPEHRDKFAKIVADQIQPIIDHLDRMALIDRATVRKAFLEAQRQLHTGSSATSD